MSDAIEPYEPRDSVLLDVLLFLLVLLGIVWKRRRDEDE